MLPSALRNETPNAEQEKPYQYIYEVGDKTKVVAKAKPPSNMAERDWNSFTPYPDKISSSISRTKRRIYELIMCNEWDYVVNLKINTHKFDGCDLDSFMRIFSKWLQNYSARKTGGVKIEYVLVPERGRKGVWHLHGVMNGIPLEHLSPFKRGVHPRELVEKGYLNWEAYENKFGYNSIDYGIRSKEAVAMYISKRVYLSAKIRDLHKKMYYCSQALDRPKEIARGYDLVSNDFDYGNKHTDIKWYDVA